MKLQRRLASAVLKCSPKRVWLDEDHLADIKEAITRQDIRGLIKADVISKIQKKGVSRVRARETAQQKKKGRQRNAGSRKGTRNARFPEKKKWMQRIRKQRVLIKVLKTKKKISSAIAKELYRKAKGGFFRSRGHLKLYINEHMSK